MRTVKASIIAVALVGATVSCGDVARQGRSPVYLVMDSLQAAKGNDPNKFFGNLVSDVIFNVTSPAPCTLQAPCPTIFGDLGQATIRLSLKDIGPPGFGNTPTSNNEVTITSYHVEYVRADGRNQPGVDVPYPFDGGATGTVGVSGDATISFVLVRNTAKAESPLVQLRSNGVILTTIGQVTFYGRDQAGNDVSVTGQIQIDFGNFGDS